MSTANPSQKNPHGYFDHGIAFLSIYAGQLKGFYRDEGIDLELILMPATLASSAVLTGHRPCGAVTA
jgi:ABC-type nitrate/sulfonate/bicarbonate transport system substrate-binding protein